MPKERPIVRPARRSDCGELLELMKGLARFEGYIDDFAVTEEDLEHLGFGPSPAYSALVGVDESRLVGMLVYYIIPFTYDLKPTLYVKELFVSEGARSSGLGGALMKEAATEAASLGCGRMKWDVLNTNVRAKSFYTQLGAFHDNQWEGFVLNEQAIGELAESSP